MLEQHDHHPTVPLVLLPLNVISLLAPSFPSLAEGKSMATLETG